MKLFTKVGRRQTHSLAGNFFLLLILVVLGAFMMLPFIYAISQSLKPIEELFVFLVVASPYFVLIAILIGVPVVIVVLIIKLILRRNRKKKAQQ